MSKINQIRASRYFAAKVPEIKEEINVLTITGNFAGVLQAVVNHLKSLLQERQIKTMTSIIRNVGWVYARGSQYIKEIIGNLFVRSFEGLRKRCGVPQWQLLYCKFPPAFRKIYVRQTHNNLIKIQ